MASQVRTRTEQGVLVVELADPSGFPRLARAVLLELQRCFESAAKHSDAHAIVLTGTDRAFCSGADLEEVAALDATEAVRFSAWGQGLMRTVEQCPKPVIAAVRGYCLGGGFDLAIACHIRVAAEDAVFGHPGGSLGILTGWGGTQRLTRIIGRARATELLATGSTIGADQALACKLVSAVTPPEQTIPTAVDWAARCARRGAHVHAR